jgi:hypothetical protein
MKPTSHHAVPTRQALLLRLLALAGLAACGQGSTGGGAGAAEACTEGAVAARCACGGSVVASGYCCSGVSGPASCDEIEAADYYVAPWGDDAAAGDLDHPFRTVTKAHGVAAAGDLVYFRGGTYPAPDPARLSTRLSGRSGTAGAMIRFFAYPGETVVFDFSGRSSTTTGESQIGIDFTGDYCHWKGIEVVGVPQRAGQYMAVGFVLRDSSHCLLERMGFHDNSGSGLIVTGDSDDNLVLDCDAWDNGDPETGYEDANGFTSTTAAGTTNTFRRCRAWRNSDDGFDHYSTTQGQGVVVHDQCWAFRNGYLPDDVTPAGNGVGFKFGKPVSATGSVTRIATRCLAFGNRDWGFDQNQHPDPIRLLNCTAHANGQGINLNQLQQRHVVRNSVSFGNGAYDVAIYDNANVTHDHNSWDTSGVAASAADFLSTDWTAMDGPRGSDGSLPVLDYLRLVADSDLVDAGVDVGLDYAGDAPDLGCFER